jgi:hypothetical protein
VLCGCQIAFMTERGKIAYDFKQPADNYFSENKIKVVARDQFDPYSPITHATILMRTHVMHELGGYRSAFLTAEDVDLWLRMIQKYKTVVMNELLYFVRLSGSSATQVHGWKNEFFRNLAFTYYDQREQRGEDDLQLGKKIDIPVKQDNKSEAEVAKTKENGILYYRYPLAINAKDYSEARKYINMYLLKALQSSRVLKALIFPIIGKESTQRLVKVKRLLRK